MRAALLALALLAGCACPDHVELESGWAPLRRIQRDASVPAEIYQTYGDLVLCADPCAFLALSKVEQGGILRHEQVHALHQQEMGVHALLSACAASPAFRWQEEQAGWRVQLVYVVQHGETVDPAFIAKILANDYHSMVSYEAALVWVNSVLASIPK